MASESLELFSINLLQTLLHDNKDQNIFYSPLSIMAAFSMLLLGSKKQSAEQIIHALKFDSKSPDVIHKNVSDLIEKCITPLSEYDKSQLSIANGLFTQHDFQINGDYKCDLQKYYKNEMKEINFGGPTAVKEVNQWIENKTNNKIKDMFSENSFNNFTKLVLANAIYFKGSFKDGFPEQSTTDKPFHKDKNTEMKIKMMQTGGDFRFAENAEVGLKVIEVPFQNYNLKLFLILPTTRFGLDAALAKLKEKQFQNLISSMQLYRVAKLQVPKFKTETQMDLKTIMKSLGVTDVFDDQKADLKGISNVNLHVDKAIHKTFLDVNEHGVEAAAATAMSICCMSMPFYANEIPIEFIIDEPFLISIYHNAADSIVFLGRMNNP